MAIATTEADPFETVMKYDIDSYEEDEDETCPHGVPYCDECEECEEGPDEYDHDEEEARRGEPCLA